MSLLRGNITVSRLTWDVVRQANGIEEQHHILHVPTPQVSLADVPALQRDAFAELENVGLARGTNVDPELLGVIRMLAAPPLELHGWVSRPNRPTLSAVAASGPGGAILAFADETDIHVRPIRSDDLAVSIVGLMPPLRPGRGQSVSIPWDVYRELIENGAYHESGSGGFLEQNTQRTRLERDADVLLALLKQPRLGGGRIYGAARPKLGRKRKTEFPVTYLDNESGRWLLKHKPSSNGDVWAVATPATPDLLVTELTDLLTTVS
jgi:hypothetical protein